jgi:site-specific DNA-methyltransferase (adenine-specific)
MPVSITHNTLFYGDNLPILRERVADESVDLIYLDPLFNSSRTYNVLFKQESGEEAEAQIAAFEDTWHWNQAAEATYYELIQNAPPHVAQMLGALREFIGGGRAGGNQMMAYLVMMAARLPKYSSARAITPILTVSGSGSIWNTSDDQTASLAKG